MQSRSSLNTNSQLATGDPDLALKLAFWQAYLKNIPILQLHPEHRFYPDSAVHPTLTIPASTIALASALARQFKTTVPTVLTAVFYTTLYRHTWQPDIFIAIENSMDTTLLRCGVESNLTFIELLKKIIESFDQVNRNKVSTALLQQQKIYTPDLSQIILAFNQQEHPTADYFTLTLNEQTDKSYHCSINFNPTLFQTPIAERFLGHFNLILQGVVREPELSLLHIPFLLDEEMRELDKAHNTAPAADAPTTTDFIHEFFSRRAALSPDATAITFYQDENHIDKITYQELDRRSTELASLLIQMGIGPEITTGVCINRSINLFVAMLAVFKAGGVVVPMETTATPNLHMKIMDTTVNVVLVDNDTCHLFQESSPSLFPFNIQQQGLIKTLQRQLKPTYIKPNLQPENLAYIEYTSGTTGRPKGVMITHTGVTNLINALLDKGIPKTGKVLCTAPPTFDCFFFEWIQGMMCELVMIGENRLSEQVLQKVINEQQITHLTLLPAVLAHLDPSQMPSVEDIVTMGASPHADTIQACIDAEKITHNEYGPSEITVAASKNICTTSMPLSCIGEPIRNFIIRILDPRYGVAECPVGIQGEIYIEGPGLARGYVGNISATEEKFPHKRLTHHHIFASTPAKPTASATGKRRRESTNTPAKLPAVSSKEASTPDSIHRMYRTGDLGMRLPDNTLLFQGRCDRQVKIHGIRLELDGFETILRSHAEIKDAVIVVSADQTLTAYLIPHQIDHTSSLEELNQFLATTSLPSVARLQAVFYMDKFPLTLNGKVDMKALPQQPTINMEYERNLMAAQTIPHKLQIIWSRILRYPAESFTIDQTFGDLGGDSLSLLQLETEIKKVFNCSLNPQQLTFNITITSLDNYIQIASNSTFDNNLVLFGAAATAPPLERSDNTQSASFNFSSPS